MGRETSMERWRGNESKEQYETAGERNMLIYEASYVQLRSEYRKEN